MATPTKEKLAQDILAEIESTKKKMDGSFSNEQSDATNRVAIATLYVALSNLIKE